MYAVITCCLYRRRTGEKTRASSRCYKLPSWYWPAFISSSLLLRHLQDPLLLGLMDPKRSERISNDHRMTRKVISAQKAQSFIQAITKMVQCNWKTFRKMLHSWKIFSLDKINNTSYHFSRMSYDFRVINLIFSAVSYQLKNLVIFFIILAFDI